MESTSEEEIPLYIIQAIIYPSDNLSESHGDLGKFSSERARESPESEVEEKREAAAASQTALEDIELGYSLIGDGASAISEVVSVTVGDKVVTEDDIEYPPFATVLVIMVALYLVLFVVSLVEVPI
jgi:hypothetical protein